GAAPFGSRRCPIAGPLLELCKLERQCSIVAERMPAGEKRTARLIPQAPVRERLTPFAIRCLTLWRAGRPAPRDGLERVELIQRRVDPQLQATQRRALRQPLAR